jgi:3D (Asp-Asp-Asp) domain-containing protein
MEAKCFFSKSSNILSVAILLASLTTFGVGIYAYDTYTKDTQKQLKDKERQIELLEDSIYKEKGNTQIYMNKVEEQRTGIYKLLKENKDLKKKVTTYKNKSESPTRQIPSRGEPAKKKIYVEATAYTAFCDTGCTGVTATGLNVSNTTKHQGVVVIAVDPRVIPLHSKVRVDTEKGDSFLAIAEDTGGAIKGGRIDVLVSNNSKAMDFGRQGATVTILD